MGRVGQSRWSIDYREDTRYFILDINIWYFVLSEGMRLRMVDIMPMGSVIRWYLLQVKWWVPDRRLILLMFVVKYFLEHVHVEEQRPLFISRERNAMPCPRSEGTGHCRIMYRHLSIICRTKIRH